MNWELRRLDEGSGFVALRIMHRTAFLCQLLYGSVFLEGRQIISPLSYMRF